jgi:hypothetical protein
VAMNKLVCWFNRFIRFLFIFFFGAERAKHEMRVFSTYFEHARGLIFIGVNELTFWLILLG